MDGGICSSILPRDSSSLPPEKSPLSCSTEHGSSPLPESHSSHFSSAILASFRVTLKPACRSPEKLRIGECERCAPQRAGLPRLAASEELGGSDTAERICGIRDASAAAGPGGRRANPRWNLEFEWRRMGKLSRAEHWWRHLAPGFSNMVRWRWWRCRDGTFTNFARHAHTWLRATCTILLIKPAWLWGSL